VILLAGLLFLPARSGTQAAVPLQLILLFPDSGPPGATIDVVGFGFTPGQVGNYFLGIGPEIPLGKAIVDENGNFEWSFVVPHGAEPGPATVVSRSLETPLEEARAPFTVEDRIAGPPDAASDKVELCEVTITLVKASVKGDGSTTPYHFDIETIPARPGTGVGVDVTEGTDADINQVVRQYRLPKASFPHRVLVAAKVEGTRGPVTFSSHVQHQKKIVICPSTHIVQVELRWGGTIIHPSTTLTLDYKVEVKEVP
jgi:hypothetical protein